MYLVDFEAMSPTGAFEIIRPLNERLMPSKYSRWSLASRSFVESSTDGAGWSDLVFGSIGLGSFFNASRTQHLGRGCGPIRISSAAIASIASSSSASEGSEAMARDTCLAGAAGGVNGLVGINDGGGSCFCSTCEAVLLGVGSEVTCAGGGFTVA